MSNLAFALPFDPIPQAVSRPMRILFAANFPESATSGIGNHLTSLAAALAARGHSVEVLWRESFPAIARQGAISRLTFPFALARWIQQEAQRGRVFDVVNVHEPSGLWCTVSRKLFAGFPAVVVTSHGIERRAWELDSMRNPTNWKSRIIFPLTQLAQSDFSLKHADRLAVLSSEDLSYATKRLGIREDRVTVLSNGVDPPLLEVRWAPSNMPRLLFVGTWIPRKGTRFLANLFHSLREDRPALELCVAGTGLAERDVLSAFAPEDRNRVTVIPQIGRQQLFEILSRDQIFLLPSSFEGMPLSVLEAMAAGLPCVTSDTCGMKDLITHGKTGYRIALAERLWLKQVRSLLESAELRVQIGHAARHEARTRTWDLVAIQWEALFARALQKPDFAKQYDAWHSKVIGRDDLELDLKNPWHTFARTQLPEVQGAAVLDVACGRGQLSRWLAMSGAKVVALDFSHAAVKVAGKRLSAAGGGAAICADAGRLPLSDASVDFVVSCETLEHVPSPKLCLREFARVLRPGGRLVLTTENYFNIWSLYRLYCAALGRTFNSGDVPQPIENWMFSPATRWAIRRAGFRIERTDGEEHHLYLLPRTNPTDCEARWLSRNKMTRALLRYFGRRFYVVARRVGPAAN